MKFIDKKEKIDYLLKLIQNESTGNVRDLSDRIHVSTRTLFRYIDYLRNIGYQISYCLRRETYYLIQDNEEKRWME